MPNDPAPRVHDDGRKLCRLQAPLTSKSRTPDRLDKDPISTVAKWLPSPIDPLMFASRESHLHGKKSLESDVEI
jgi:hypothetical protein